MGILEELPAAGYISTQKTKRRYGISNSTLYAWVASGRLPPLYKIGPRAVRFRVEDLRKFEQKFEANKRGDR